MDWEATIIFGIVLIIGICVLIHTIKEDLRGKVHQK